MPVHDALLLQTFLRRRSRPVPVTSRLLKRRIWIRPYTSDIGVLFKVLGAEDYQVDGLTRPPKVIVDAGANVGLSTLYFAWKYPSASIFAIEPEESNLEILRLNCGDLPSVRILPCALWSRRSDLSITNLPGTNDAWNKWTFAVGEGGSGKRVASVTLDEILQAAGHDYIDILKIDIEGAEKEIFREGFEHWLPRVGLIVIELHDRFVPGCSHNFYSAITRRHFEQELRGENIIVRF